MDDATRALLTTLVGCDSTSRVSNLPLLDHVGAVLERHGVDHRRVPSADGTKANLLATIGPPVDGGVVLTGHTDCVPVDGQPWRTDPFTVTADGDRLYGRGVTDMKGFLALVLAAVPRMVAADLQRPITLVLTYDEELGTIGAPSAVEALLTDGPRPAVAWVGEPTSLETVTAHKGVRAFTTTVTGRDGHSSQPQLAANAVAALARIATFVDDLAAEVAADPDRRDDRFEPPHTTFNLATVRGGQAINIVPRLAELTWEYRPVPGDDSSDFVDRVRAFADDEVLPRLRATTGDGMIAFATDAAALAFAGGEDGAAERLVRELTGYAGAARTVPFATDGGHFQAAGISTVVCGPGSITQAHQPDEWIEVDQLDRCAAAIDRLVTRLCDPAPPT